MRSTDVDASIDRIESVDDVDELLETESNEQALEESTLLDVER